MSCRDPLLRSRRTFAAPPERTPAPIASSMARKRAAIVALALCSCGSAADRASDAEPPPTVSVRDSLGVTIVEYESLTGGQLGPWRIALEDSVRIGRFGMEGDGHPAYSFGEPRGAARLIDGRIAVADRQAHTVRIFDSDGTYLRSVGRSGQGPGEYGSIEGLYRITGDSLLVVDGQARWTILDPAGNFVHSGRFAFRGEVLPQVDDAFSDGSLVIGKQAPRPDTAPPRPETSGPRTRVGEFHKRYIRHDRSGELLCDLGVFLADTWVSGGGGSSREVITMMAWSPGPVIMTQGSRFYVGDALLREVRIFRNDCALERVLRVTAARLPALPDSLLEGFPSARLPVLAAREVVEAAVESAMELRARVKPTFSDFTVDDEGNMWFREEMPPGQRVPAAVRWYVFDSEGIFRHAVLLPGRWRVSRKNKNLIIGRDFILALERGQYLEETYLLVPLIRD